MGIWVIFMNGAARNIHALFFFLFKIFFFYVGHLLKVFRICYNVGFVLRIDILAGRHVGS